MKRKTSKPKLNGIGASTLIMALFLGSAALRIIAGASSALAEAELASDKPERDEASSFQQLAMPETLDERERLAVLHNALQERDKSLTLREEEQQKRQETIERATERLQKDIQRLEQAEAELRKTLALAEGAAEGDLSRLTTVYENMKPKEAAAVFEAMAPAFAAGFLARMRPDVAAKVMAGLSPEFAYTISVILAGRNADVPKN